MSGSAQSVVDARFTPVMPAYAAAIANGRRRGLRPQTMEECLGPGRMREVVIYATDSWALAKHWMQKGIPAVVIEPGPLYDFKWARGWIVCAVTRNAFTGLKDWIQAQGVAWATHAHDPAWIDEREARLSRR